MGGWPASAHPVRIQRRRTRGWRAPAGAVYVGRPTQWENPLRIQRRRRKWIVTTRDGQLIIAAADRHEAHAVAVDLYRRMLAEHPRCEEDVRAALAGRDLMCWCPPDLPCHADVLLEIANTKNGDHHDH